MIIKSNRSLKGQAGYRNSTDSRKCDNCLYCNVYRYHGKNYRKCQLIGVSHSAATDIKKSGFCNRWESMK